MQGGEHLRILASLYHFNDIDHITPILWHCAEQGDDVTVVLLDPTKRIGKDPRLRMLSDHSNIRFEFLQDVLAVPGASVLLRPLRGPRALLNLRERIRGVLWASSLTRRFTHRFLNEGELDVYILEWGQPDARNRRELLAGALEQGIPTICVPHGLNIYLNRDIHPGRESALKAGRQILEPLNVYDAYVHQSEYHRDQDVRFGLDPSITHVMGSARYCPAWHEVNKGLYDPYEPAKPARDNMKVVFMLPHWSYNVDKAESIELIKAIASQPSIHLVIKDHTRGAGALPAALREDLSLRENVECTMAAPSVSLIRWADAVVNFGSSIGIEVLLQGKALINPGYLHANTTIFDKTGASHRTQDAEATVETLRRLDAGTLQAIPSDAVSELIDTVVYGGKEPHDVLAAYYGLIREVAR